MSYLEIKKSKFYGFAFKIKNVDEVKQILNQIKTENKKASHVCYAFKFSNGENLEKAFDDGEPSQTAGKPILNVLQKQNLTNVLVVVVRYFGGIKLGAGGLIRAYGKTAALAVKDLQ